MMTLAFALTILLLVWRLLALPPSVGHVPDVLRSDFLPLLGLVAGGIALAVPFLSGASQEAEFPVTVRNAYVLSSHTMYATAAAALLYLGRTAAHRAGVRQMRWSLVALFAVVATVYGTTLLGAIWDRSIAGISFYWDRPHTARMILFVCGTLSFLLACMRTLRRAPASASYWGEPFFLGLGVAVKIAAAIWPGRHLDALGWL